MSHRFKLLFSILFAFSTMPLSAADASTARETYFRSNAGVAEDAGNLPNELDPEKFLAWRVPLDPGHSTPLLLDDRLLLTTFKNDSKQLATVALDANTGKTVWRT